MLPEADDGIFSCHAAPLIFAAGCCQRLRPLRSLISAQLPLFAATLMKYAFAAAIAALPSIDSFRYRSRQLYADGMPPALFRR